MVSSTMDSKKATVKNVKQIGCVVIVLMYIIQIWTKNN